MKTGTFEALNPKHPLFELLQSNPFWWSKIKANDDFYIAIRKDNYLNVYFQDACFAKIAVVGDNNTLTITTNVKYLSDIPHSSYGKNHGNITASIVDPLSCETILNKIKENIVTFFDNSEIEKKGEKISEKYIQWEWAVSHKNEILDVEFAYNAWKKKIRIDIALFVFDYRKKAYCLKFIELKRINDNRMLCKDIEKVPEIISQMKSYKEFIDDKYSDLLNYYNKIYALRKAIGLPVLSRNDDQIDLRRKPCLSIANVYTAMNDERQKRIGVYDEKIKQYTGGMLRHIADKKYVNDFDYELFQRTNRTMDVMDCRYWKTQKKRSNSMPIGNSLNKELLVPVKKYFIENRISFWKGQSEEKPECNIEDYDNSPTTNPLSSQNNCLNHLFPIKDDEASIKAILNKACPNIQLISILNIPDAAYTRSYISFEFTYKNKELLSETTDSRGVKCTSIDAIIYALDVHGKYWLFPIEWKYTERYFGKEACQSSLQRYEKLVGKKSNLTKWCPLYRMDPYYELSRQTLLVEKIINNVKSVFHVDGYMHLFVCPERNPLWGMVKKHYVPTLKDSSLFCMISPEKLMEPLTGTKPELIESLKKRYW